MKKILIIGVNYKSYDLLQRFLESVKLAAEQVKGVMQVDVKIADNSENNKGYLGGALPIYNELAQDYDFVSISNVDLELAPNFFEQLLLISAPKLGGIAPDVYTEKIMRHENPYMLTRPTKRNFFVWGIIYSCTWIYRLYHWLFLLKTKKRKIYPACELYAGHGSFIILTKEFIQYYPAIQFPGFMYGEEIFMAELVRAAGLKVWYAPSLRVFNVGNISTGLVNQKKKSQWSKESLRAIYQQFFK